MSVQVKELSESEVDNDVGKELLEEWDEQSSWLPDDFIENTTVESTELIVCERQIDRAVFAEEYTESVELSQSEYRKEQQSLLSPSEYHDRENILPEGGEWPEGTLAYEVPDSHRESNCSGCSGSGRLACQSCGASGNVHCSNCGGTGRQETERECPRCEGYGQVRENVDCGQCAGKGYEVVDDQCPQCRGTGEVSCDTCGGNGEVRCDICEGDGLTHKLDILYREFDPKTKTEHTTHGVPEKHIEDADGQHVSTDGGVTSLDKPKHEIETREIDVLEVDYKTEEHGIIGDRDEENEYSLYYIEDKFKKDDYPKSSTRKLLTAVAVIAVIVAVVLVVMSV